MRALVWTVGAVLAAAPVLACPTAVDMVGGVRVTYEDGGQDIYRRLNPQEVSLIYADEGEPFKEVLGKGIYLLSSVPTRAGSTDESFRVDYGRPTRALPDLGPGQRLKMEVVETWDSARFEFVETYTSGRLQEMEIGGCRYSVFPITLDRVSQFGDEDRENLIYLVELGFAYFLSDLVETESGLRSGVARIEAVR